MVQQGMGDRRYGIIIYKGPLQTKNKVAKYIVVSGSIKNCIFNRK